MRLPRKHKKSIKKSDILINHVLAQNSVALHEGCLYMVFKQKHNRNEWLVINFKHGKR